MVKILNILDKYLLIILIFLYPLFFLPIFVNVYLTSKLLLLIVGIILLAIIKLINSILNGSIEFSSSKFDILIIALGLIYLLTGIFITPNIFDAFFNQGTSSFVILAIILYFFANQLKKDGREKVEFGLILSAFFSSISQILSFTGLINNNFLIFENYINNCLFLFIILPIAVHKIFNSEKVRAKIFFAIIGFIIFVAGFTNLYLILPTKNQTLKLPSLKTGWIVTVDTVKTSPFFGIGPSNFLQAFNAGRPLTANMDLDWNSKYVISTNTLFTLIPEIGLVGLAIFILIFVLSLAKYKSNNPLYISILIISLSFLLIPTFPSILPIIFILLSLYWNTGDKDPDKINSRTTVVLITMPIIGIIIYSLYLSYKTFYPEYIFNQAVKAISQNDNKKVFESVNKAILLNPNIDKYHQVATEINLGLVKSIVAKKDLTDDEKNTLIKLIQQTIKEAKATVSLNSKSSSHWERLADIYTSFIPLTNEADKFAIQSYTQAISLDPINPILRIKLGGIYFGQKKFDEAIKLFELAVLAKPDFPNARYNLAIAYKENRQLEKAIEQMNITLSLVGKDTKDFELAKKELETIEGLTKPEPIPEPVIEPQIEITD